MVSVLALSAVERGFEPHQRLYNWYLWLLRWTHVLRSMSKDRLDRNRANVSEWSDMSTRKLFLSGSTIQIHLSVLVQYKADVIMISSNVTWSLHDIPEKLLCGVKQHSLTHSLTHSLNHSLKALQIIMPSLSRLFMQNLQWNRNASNIDKLH